MKFIKQLAVILTISLIAELMEYLIPLPVAASMYGLVLMLVGLMTKIIPLEKVEGAADFLVGILPIMFIPPTVGIMTSVDALKEMLVPLCVISVVSTILIMAVTGRVSQGIIRSGDRHLQSTQAAGEHAANKGRENMTSDAANEGCGSVISDAATVIPEEKEDSRA